MCFGLANNIDPSRRSSSEGLLTPPALVSRAEQLLLWSCLHAKGMRRVNYYVGPLLVDEDRQHRQSSQSGPPPHVFGAVNATLVLENPAAEHRTQQQKRQKHCRDEMDMFLQSVREDGRLTNSIPELVKQRGSFPALDFVFVVVFVGRLLFMLVGCCCCCSHIRED